MGSKWLVNCYRITHILSSLFLEATDSGHRLKTRRQTKTLCNGQKQQTAKQPE